MLWQQGRMQDLAKNGGQWRAPGTRNYDGGLGNYTMFRCSTAITTTNELGTVDLL